jgi:hypothetical protein
MLIPVYINALVAPAFGQFYAQEPVTLVPLASSLREQYYINIIRET